VWNLSPAAEERTLLVILGPLALVTERAGPERVVVRKRHRRHPVGVLSQDPDELALCAWSREERRSLSARERVF
jgi:hypothetical protein